MNNIYLGFWEILALDAPPWSRAGTGEAIFMYQLLVLESGLWSISFQWRKEWKFLRPTLNGVNFSQHPHSSAKRVELVRSIFSQVDKSLPDDGLQQVLCSDLTAARASLAIQLVDHSSKKATPPICHSYIPHHSSFPLITWKFCFGKRKVQTLVLTLYFNLQKHITSWWRR